MTAPAKPQPLRPQWEGIPTALRDAPSWVLWRYEWRKDKKGAGKWTKPPHRAVGKGYAKTDDPGTWSDFHAARQAADSADGVGIVLTEDLVGVDLDHVVDEHGDIQPWAAEVIERFRGCYVERSPGGDGIRIFCRGVARHSGKGGPENRCEVYDKSSPRYLTVTGCKLVDGEVIEAQAALDWLHVTHMQKPAQKATEGPTGAHSAVGDDEVLRMAAKARNGPKFSRLFAGDAGDDPSTADAALIGILSFWTQDPAQLDRLFRRSGLMRPKWDEQRGDQTYGELTIKTVLGMGGERFKPGHQHVDDWPEPTPLPDALPAVDAFDEALLPETLRPWVMDIAHRMQCPPDFVAVGALVSASSLIGARVQAQPKALDDWRVVPNLWGTVVGRPGVMKSPALNEVLQPLYRLQAAESERWGAELKQWLVDEKLTELQAEDREKQARKVANTDPDKARKLLQPDEADPKPLQRRFVVNDTTVEKLGELMADSPWGLLAYRDELYGLMRDLEKPGQESARTFYLMANDGDKPYTFDRIIRGHTHIPRVCLAMIGGIQPGRIAEYVRSAVGGGTGDDGFLQRMALLVWPDVSGDFVNIDQLPDATAKQAAWSVFERLAALQPNADDKPRVWRFDAAAQELFVEWRIRHETLLRGGELHPALESHLAKYRKLIPALALIFALVDTPEAGAIGKRELLRSLAWSDYLRSHAERLYSAATQPEVSAARTLLSRLQAGKLHDRDGVLLDSFTPRVVALKGWAGLTTPEAVRKAADVLVEFDWLRREVAFPSVTGGRPSEQYFINPAARRA